MERKRRKEHLDDKELENMLNTTGLSAVIDLSDNETEEVEEREQLASDDEIEDNLDADVLYDSDLDEEYVPTTREADTSDSEEEWRPLSQRQRRIRTSTPRKPVGQSLTHPHTSHVPAASAGPSTAASGSTADTASTSGAPASPAASSATPVASSATPAASTAGRKRRRARDEQDVPAIVDFQCSTISSASKFRWNCRPQTSSATRTPSRNIIRETPGPTQLARSADTPEKCFRLLFTDDILDEICEWTNKRIEIHAAKYVRRTGVHSPVERTELLAFLGVLIFSGYQRANHLSISEMWAKDTGTPLYRAAMSQVRFEFLKNCLRFDDPTTREERKKQDKFAPIRKIWNIFTENCKKLYTPSEHLTVDEQLLGFRGRCPFRMYIPNKPAKYGIKLVLICDNQSKYLLGAIPYLGKDSTMPQGGINIGHHYTKTLTSPYHNSNRNVTTDNWFTSVSLVSDLKNCGMTLVGTLRANKKEVPIQMKDKTTRELGSSAFLFTKDMTLVSYVPATSKTKKIVLLLSSVHMQPTLGETGKPEIIEFYNSTKGGVDTYDQMCAIYSCGRMTRRWPMCVFYGMLNGGLINSWVIHTDNMKRTGGKTEIRRHFMQHLVREVIKPWAQERLNTPTLSIPLKRLIIDIWKLPSPASTTSATGQVVAENRYPPVRCSGCPSRKDRKTRVRCHRCQHPVCQSHFYALCVKCKDQ